MTMQEQLRAALEAAQAAQTPVEVKQSNDLADRVIN